MRWARLDGVIDSSGEPKLAPRLVRTSTKTSVVLVLGDKVDLAVSGAMVLSDYDVAQGFESAAGPALRRAVQAPVADSSSGCGHLADWSE